MFAWASLPPACHQSAYHMLFWLHHSNAPDAQTSEAFSLSKWGRGPQAEANVSISENHVWSLLLHQSFVTWKLWKNASKSSFFYYYNGTQKHEWFVGFENTYSRAKTYIILTLLNYVNFYAQYCWWRQLLWSLECQSLASTACKLHD